MFNALNHVNFTGVTTGAYTIAGTSPANQILTFNSSSSFGSYQNANSNFVYNPRQVQIGARLTF